MCLVNFACTHRFRIYVVTENDNEMVNIKPSTSFTMRKETPVGGSCDSIFEILDDPSIDCSKWRRETPVEKGYNSEIVEITPSTSFTMRKETPAGGSCDSICKMLDDSSSNCSKWRRETPVEKEYNSEIVKIKPSTSFTIRKETPAGESCYSICEMLDDPSNDCSNWHRETPIEEEYIPAVTENNKLQTICGTSL